MGTRIERKFTTEAQRTQREERERRTLLDYAGKMPALPEGGKEGENNFEKETEIVQTTLIRDTACLHRSRNERMLTVHAWIVYPVPIYLSLVVSCKGG